jgi:hypothetical protein
VSDQQPAHIAESVADLGSYDGWQYNTRIIREWLRGGAVSTDALEAQFRLWLDYWAARNDGDAGA